MKKNAVITVSIIINIVLLGLFSIYKFTPYLDYAVLVKSLPRLCEYIETTQSDIYEGVQLCHLEEETTTELETVTTTEDTVLEDEVTENVTTATIVLKENNEDSELTDVNLLNAATNNDTTLLTLSDVYTGHYHSNEYHNENIYILRRIGYDGYPDEEWTDELWKYDADQVGTKLFTGKGIDFRVRDDEELITITTNENVYLLDADGNTVHTFEASDVSVNPTESHSFSFAAWETDSVWLNNTLGASVSGLVHIDTTTYTVETYNLVDLLVGSEYAFNTATKKLAYSNYPVFFDVEDAEEYEASTAEVSLMVYDLETEVSEEIATSVAKKFEPQWINDSTLEYTNPNGENIVTVAVK